MADDYYEDFYNEWNEGAIQVRDKLQFELKSEFFINPNFKQNIYKQEFFLFIPSALQINSQTYPKEKFYLDQTNLIRYKTPSLTLEDLLNLYHINSPLNRLQSLLDSSATSLNTSSITDELKLLGALFRAAIRNRVKELTKDLSDSNLNMETYSHSIHMLCSQASQICLRFRELHQLAIALLIDPLVHRYFKYVDETLSLAINDYFLLLLRQLKQVEDACLPADKQQICQVILQEAAYRKKKHLHPKSLRGTNFAEESILYREGLLNRFTLESLMLNTYRFSLEDKHSNILGSIAAGLAMLVYMILFVWKASNFVITSFPFIAFAVIFYILKDRLKEGLKKFYYKQAYRWFPDYSTEVVNSKGFKVGQLTENFAFIDVSQLPAGFLAIRNVHFHEELQALQRHETIIQYKREVTLNHPGARESRRRELTTIFRLNVHHFLQKASNTFEPALFLDPNTQEVKEKLLPKVYHLNIIIRNTYLQSNHTLSSEIKTFRVVVDKEGIKRVEHIHSKRSYEK